MSQNWTSLSEHGNINTLACVSEKFCLFCLFVALPPTREVFTSMEMSPLPMKIYTF